MVIIKLLSKIALRYILIIVFVALIIIFTLVTTNGDFSVLNGIVTLLLVALIPIVIAVVIYLKKRH